VFSGSHQIKGWLNGTSSLAGIKEGQSELRFKDGGHYTFKWPTMSIENLMSKTRTELFYDYGVVKDEVNGIAAEIKFNLNFDSSAAGVVNRYTMGWFTSTLGTNLKAKRAARGDDFEVKII